MELVTIEEVPESKRDKLKRELEEALAEVLLNPYSCAWNWNKD